ncbi:MAG: hypothetical protein LUC87_11250 [Clostridiales bacterium]|nr:hypothetical protein [Clostridiales bacterium]
MSRRDGYKDLHGYHKPTNEQHEGVRRNCTAYYDQTIRVNRIFAIVTLIVAVCMIPTAVSSNVVIAIIALCILALSVYCFSGVRRARKCQALIQAGEYAVLEGTVWKTSTNEQAEAVNVMFRAALDGGTFQRWVKVRTEGVTENSPLLLVCGGAEAVRPEFMFVLTPYMLSEEGASRHF